MNTGLIWSKNGKNSYYEPYRHIYKRMKKLRVLLYQTKLYKVVWYWTILHFYHLQTRSVFFIQIAIILSYFFFFLEKREFIFLYNFNFSYTTFLFHSFFLLFYWQNWFIWINHFISFKFWKISRIVNSQIWIKYTILLNEFRVL